MVSVNLFHNGQCRREPKWDRLRPPISSQPPLHPQSWPQKFRDRLQENLKGNANFPWKESFQQHIAAFIAHPSSFFSYSHWSKGSVLCVPCRPLSNSSFMQPPLFSILRSTPTYVPDIKVTLCYSAARTHYTLKDWPLLGEMDHIGTPDLAWVSVTFWHIRHYPRIYPPGLHYIL